MKLVVISLAMKGEPASGKATVNAVAASTALVNFAPMVSGALSSFEKTSQSPVRPPAPQA